MGPEDSNREAERGARRFKFSLFHAVLLLLVLTAGGVFFYLRQVKHAANAATSASQDAPPPPAEQEPGLLQGLVMSMIRTARTPSSVKGSPIPNGSKVRTQKDVDREFFEWEERGILECHRQMNKGKTPENPKISRYLSDALRLHLGREDAPKGEEIRKRGQALIDAGCQDPQVLVSHGEVLLMQDQVASGTAALNKGIKAMEAAKYPKLILALADMVGYWSTFKLKLMPEHPIFESRRAEALSTLLEAANNGEVAPGQSHHILSLIYIMMDYLDDDKEAWIALGGVARSKPRLDPWLLHMIEGEARVAAAWKARGSGWADTVTEAGWKNFGANLERARTELVAAWKLHPEKPAAAARMITVVMGGCDAPGESVRTWFDRAVAGRMDYIPAYRMLMRALLPRWGGSHGAMVSVAGECLATGRFDTDVPLLYLETLREIAAEYPCDAWRAVFHHPGVHEKLEELFAGYERARPEWGDFLAQQRIAVECWCGNYAKAKELLAKRPPTEKLDYECHGWTVTWGGVGRKGVEAEIRAFTGPEGTELAKAEEHCMNGETTQAIGMFTAAMEASKADPVVYGYLRERIGYLMLKPTEDTLTAGSFRTTALNRAAVTSQTAVIRFLVEHGADVNAQDRGLWTPLMSALIVGNNQDARYLLEHGADPNIQRQRGTTALDTAVSRNDVAMAALLLEKGAKTEIPLEDGRTPLIGAVSIGNVAMTRLLLDKGANPNVFITSGRMTPLHIAANYGRTEIVKMLLAKGARRDAKLKNGQTPLDMARQQRQSAAVALLAEPDAAKP